MGIRQTQFFACVFLLFASLSRADTLVSAKEYSLVLSHGEVSRTADGLQLRIDLANKGTHDLYDVRLYLQEAASDVFLDQREPARILSLNAGQSTSLTWSFNIGRRVNGPLRNVIFRIQAVDQSTQQIVQFNQRSLENRP